VVVVVGVKRLCILRCGGCRGCWHSIVAPSGGYAQIQTHGICETRVGLLQGERRATLVHYRIRKHSTSGQEAHGSHTGPLE